MTKPETQPGIALPPPAHDADAHVSEPLAHTHGSGCGCAAPEAPRERVRQKVGRNEPCWCGSGTKYKKCHADADALSPYT